MNHQSDYGYAIGAVSMRCIACGSMELDCCDGHGGPSVNGKLADRLAAQAKAIGETELTIGDFVEVYAGKTLDDARFARIVDMVMVRLPTAEPDLAFGRRYRATHVESDWPLRRAESGHCE